MPPPGDRVLGGRHLLGRPAEVDRHRLGDRRVPPRQRPVQSPVDLEDARARTGSGPAPGHSRTAAGLRQSASTCRGVRSSTTAPAGGSSASERTVHAGPHLGTEPVQPGQQGVGDGLRAAHGHRPADDVTEGGHQQPVPRGQRSPEVEHRVAGQAREQGAGPGSCPARGGPAGSPATPRPRRSRPASVGRARAAAATSARSTSGSPCRTTGPDQPAPPPAVAPSPSAVRSMSRYSSAAGRSSRGCASGTAPWARTSPVPPEVEDAERRRGRRQRVHRGADVVAEARRGELLGAQPAPGHPGGLDDQHPPPRLGEHGRGDQAVGPEPTTIGVVLGAVRGAHPRRPRRRSPAAPPFDRARPGRNGR